MDNKVVAQELIKVSRDLLAANPQMDSSINPKKFWVVVSPREHSELIDVYFDTDLRGFGLWSRGGPASFWNEVVAIYGNEAKARKHAQDLLDKR